MDKVTAQGKPQAASTPRTLRTRERSTGSGHEDEEEEEDIDAVCKLDFDRVEEENRRLIEENKQLKDEKKKNKNKPAPQIVTAAISAADMKKFASQVEQAANKGAKEGSKPKKLKKSDVYPLATVPPTPTPTPTVMQMVTPTMMLNGSDLNGSDLNLK